MLELEIIPYVLHELQKRLSITDLLAPPPPEKFLETGEIKLAIKKYGDHGNSPYFDLIAAN